MPLGFSPVIGPGLPLLPPFSAIVQTPEKRFDRAGAPRPYPSYRSSGLIRMRPTASESAICASDSVRRVCRISSSRVRACQPSSRSDRSGPGTAACRFKDFTGLLDHPAECRGTGSGRRSARTGPPARRPGRAGRRRRGSPGRTDRGETPPGRTPPGRSRAGCPGRSGRRSGRAAIPRAAGPLRPVRPASACARASATRSQIRTVARATHGRRLVVFDLVGVVDCHSMDHDAT